jgi:hypothetical protein
VADLDDVRERLNETIDALRVENERLTRERDEARRALKWLDGILDFSSTWPDEGGGYQFGPDEVVSLNRAYEIARAALLLKLSDR